MLLLVPTTMVNISLAFTVSVPGAELGICHVVWANPYDNPKNEVLLQSPLYRSGSAGLGQ